MIEVLIFLIGVAAGFALNRMLGKRSSDMPLTGASDEVQALHERNVALERDNAKLQAQAEEDKKKIALIERTEERMKTEFENLSHKIFEDRSKLFKQQNKEQLDHMLKPLNDQIQQFSSTFTSTDKNFSEKFGELKQQITGLAELNKSISEQAENLTTALKGDVKQQGDWGEIILEKTLEISGLRNGIDYEMQKSYSEQGQRRILDAIVHLPDKKDIVIDSKVSLVAYEAYASADDEETREQALKEHLQSIKNHITGLSKRNYQHIEAIRTLNYVLLFVPIEPAYLIAVQKDQTLFETALRDNIVLVCPSTLLAVLRTVHALWRLEAQNNNAREIALEAGRMYDKFVGFTDKLEGVGKQLDRASQSYDEAYKALSTGRGNLVGRADKLKKLGAKAAKELPESLTDTASETSDEASEDQRLPH